jgi:hypothetical protein
MDLESFMISFSSLVIAGLSVYLAYRARTQPYRERIYSKQVEGYSDVIVALTNFYLAALSFISIQPNGRLNDSTRPTLRANTNELNRAFHSKWQHWFLLLPKEVNDSLSAFIQLFNGISAHPDFADQYKKEIVSAQDPGGLLSDAYEKVVNECRKFMGTDRLSKETLDLIKSSDLIT